MPIADCPGISAPKLRQRGREHRWASERPKGGASPWEKAKPADQRGARPSQSVGSSIRSSTGTRKNSSWAPLLSVRVSCCVFGRRRSSDGSRPVRRRTSFTATSLKPGCLCQGTPPGGYGSGRSLPLTAAAMDEAPDAGAKSRWARQQRVPRASSGRWASSSAWTWPPPVEAQVPRAERTWRSMLRTRPPRRCGGGITRRARRAPRPGRAERRRGSSVRCRVS